MFVVKIIRAAFSRLWHKKGFWIGVARNSVLFVLILFAIYFAYPRSDIIKSGVDSATSSIANLLVDRFYRHLHVSEDGEMPLSATSYSYGPMIASVIGGKGDGLNCSIPDLTNPAFKLERGDSGLSHKFRQSCVIHDLCYRHGLATYGYSQADCDFSLQQSAFRLCAYENSGDAREVAKCRIRAKIALLGVQVGGATSYKGWDETSYFEYENALGRVDNVLIGRSVRAEARAEGEPAETLKIFSARVSGTRDISSAGRGRRLALPDDSIATSPVVTGPSGSGIAFLQRSSAGNTVIDMTSGPLAAISGSRIAALGRSEHLRTYSTDMFSSTPVTLNRPHGGNMPPIFALTPQRTQRLAGMLFDPDHPCKPATRGDLPRPYTVWPSPSVDSKNPDWTEEQKKELTDITHYIYRFFQHAPIAGPFDLGNGKKADILVATHGRTHSGGGAMSGDEYRGRIDVIALGLDTPRNELHCTILPEFKMFRDIPVTENMQPLSLLETLKGNGLIGMQRPNQGRSKSDMLSFHELWLNGPEPVILSSKTDKLAIHASFADRPPLVVKPGALGSGSDAGIILSRARLVATTRQLEVSDFSDPGEIVRLQFAALTRQGQDWTITHASTCHVRYHVTPSHTPRNCGISNPDGQFPFLPDRWAKPITANSGISIGNQLRGGQLLAGNFVQKDQLGIALVDACNRRHPIRFALQTGPNGNAGQFTPVSTELAADPTRVVVKRSGELHPIKMARTVTCSPIPPSCLAEPLDAQAVKAGGICAGSMGKAGGAS